MKPSAAEVQHAAFDEWPTLVISGDSYAPRLQQELDGRFHIYFNTPEEGEQGRTPDFTRIGFRVFDQEVMFLGLKVAVCLRGQHAGLALVRYFVNQIKDRGLSICETGRIHKPLVALTLQQSGFVPLSRAAVADILPKSSTQPDHCPRICWVANTLAPEECVSGSNGRKFYRVVTKPEAEINYPLYVPESSRVALHTAYAPSG